MFGFGKKKTPNPPPADSGSGGSKGKRSKRHGVDDEDDDDFQAELAKLGILGGGPDAQDDSDIDENDLEGELLALVGADPDLSVSGSMDELLPGKTFNTKPPAPPNPPRPQTQPKTLPPPLEPEILHPCPVPHPESDSSALFPESQGPIEDIFKAPPPPMTISEALDQRLAKYKEELDKATAANEGPSKVRRMGRIVKQYEDAIRDHKRGKPVVWDELPTPPGFPPIPVPGSAPLEENTPQVPIQTPRDTPIPAPSTNIPAPFIEENNNQTTLLLERQKEFKEAALDAKRRGDLVQAKELLRTSKGFESLIQESQQGLPVDLSIIPSLPEVISLLELRASESRVEENPNQGAAPADIPVVESSGGLPIPGEDIFHAPPPPQTILEALEQRLARYKSEVEKATTNNESRKIRQMGRIVKQYEDAIKDYNKGKPVIYEELPTPPGFAPIPVPGAVTAPPAASPEVTLGPQTQPPIPSASSTSPQAPSHPGTGSINRGANKPATKLTLQEKQLATLMQRQKQFRDAALNAKKRGDVDQARELLRTSKQFDKLIQASQGGLPVDLNTIPAPPDAVAALEAEDFELINSSDCIEAKGSTAEVFTKLENDLKEQLKMCMSTREHFKSMGDIASANRFEKLALETKKDLDTLRIAAKRQESLPKYHYETKIFSITECNSDLADDEIEISILNGINFKVPNPTEIDTFVKVELPYPSAEEAQSDKTAVIRNTNNPEYNSNFKMKIARSARNFPRFIHRHGIKLEVWSKGGFLRGSSMIGSTTVKLLPLETKCTLHDAFDILEGRKPVGKLEIKVRLREPVLTKQITQRKEKWLSIDRV